MKISSKILILFILIGCESQVSKEFLYKHSWKYNAGVYMGDFLKFSDKGLKLNERLEVYDSTNNKIAEVVNSNRTEIVIYHLSKRQNSFYVLFQ